MTNRIAIFILLSFVTFSFAQERKMKYEDYKVELERWERAQTDKDAEIKKLDEEIAALKAQLSTKNGEISSAWEEIYSAAGTSNAAHQGYVSQLDALTDKLNGLLNLDNEELYARKGELAGLIEEFEKLKEDPQSLIIGADSKISEIERLINRLESRIRGIKPSTYSVVPGDNLWNIAGKKEVFNNPFKWVSIYSVNTDQINDPDLIFPDQKFKVPHVLDRDQVVVNSGENLKKVASRVYGNAADWTKLYDANRKLIDTMNAHVAKTTDVEGGSDGKTIYPEMILSIER